MNTFSELNIHPNILKALADQGYTTPTPIQKQAIPILLQHKDLLGCAQTGTGKTAAFSIPIIQHLISKNENDAGRKKIKALIITPTRELAIQIDESFSNYGKYTKLKNTVIFGGVKQGAQTTILRQGVDILIATPGRLLDLINQKIISLHDIEYFVLDEADQMLDMGFIHDIKKIIALLPSKRQSLFFSATMSKEVNIEPKQTTAEKVSQEIYHVAKADKIKLLIHLIKTENVPSVLVFNRTKHGADKIVKLLRKANIGADAIHGN